jgi:hypothetical protein
MFMNNLGNYTMRKFMVCAGQHVILTVKRRRLRGAGHMARVEKSRNANVTLVGKPLTKFPLGRPRSRLEITLRWILGKKLRD